MDRRIQDAVLRILLNDVGHFEQIVGDLNRSVQREATPITRQETTDAVSELIGTGFAEAYLLSQKPPLFIKVDFDPVRLHELWFQLTPEGEKFARELIRQMQ